MVTHMQAIIPMISPVGCEWVVETVCVIMCIYIIAYLCIYIIFSLSLYTYIHMYNMYSNPKKDRKVKSY